MCPQRDDGRSRIDVGPDLRILLTQIDNLDRKGGHCAVGDQPDLRRFSSLIKGTQRYAMAGRGLLLC